MRHLIRFSLLLLLGVLPVVPLQAQSQPVTITDRGTYYEVLKDYTSGVDANQMGSIMMEQIKLAVPDYEALVDSYLADICGNAMTYNVLLSRTASFLPQIQEEYKAEIDGMAAMLSGGDTDAMNDGKLSKNEFYLVQLLPDVGRSTQCSAVSVFGQRADGGNTMTARALDWYDGAQHELTKIQAVVSEIHGERSICTIGYLSLFGVLTGFNDDGIFVAILDSETGFPYSATNMRSYFIDLRYALEHCWQLEDVAAYMTDGRHPYAFSHLIYLSDAQKARVVENNISGQGAGIRRALRSESSPLNPGVEWTQNGAVAAVNSFILEGNFDNHTTKSYNTARWATIADQLDACGASVTWDELKGLISSDGGNGPGSQSSGDLYNSGTQQIVLFNAATKKLEVFFKPEDGVLPGDPVFEQIPVHIGQASPVRGIAAAPEALTLHPNYPNPVSQATQLRFTLPEAGYTTVRIYNAVGALVATPFAGQLATGTHSAQWNASGLPAGVYFCRVSVGNTVVAQPLMVMR